MDLRNRFEELRGIPIEVRATVDNLRCEEISDAEKLCREPLVSVHMVTYNHACYISQAIEGVLAQETNFDYELVIGDDSSTDGTLDVCCEYQKRYPEKIRILKSERNVCDIDGRSLKVFRRCRGLYIAFHDGDDYWIDSHKLQRQIDAMAAHPSVTVAFTGGQLCVDGKNQHCPWFGGKMREGLNEGNVFFRKHLACQPGFMLTTSAVVRREALVKMYKEYEIFDFLFTLCDTNWWLGASALGDVWWDSGESIVYRRHSGGATGGGLALVVGIDAALVRMFYENKVLHVPLWRSKHAYQALNCRLCYCSILPFAKRVREFVRVVAAYRGFLWFYHIATWVAVLLFLMGRERWWLVSPDLFVGFTHKLHRVPHLIWWVMYGKRKCV